jgi:redox-sensitive bicupin YhaK (pirin superfamily)
VERAGLTRPDLGARAEGRVSAIRLTPHRATSDMPSERMPHPDPKPKTVDRVLPPPPSHWVGDGFYVRSIFSYSEDPETFSPFLLLDYAAPMEFEPTRDRRGVGPHPHRGFETVTVALQGEVEHRDSAGNRGRIGPGDVQWMTAASGILHEELQSQDFGRRGGTFEMAQVWVNLPAKHKMSPPRYQDLLASQIPVVPLPDGSGEARVIAGDVLGTRGPAKTFTPVELFEVRIRAGRSARLALPDGHTALLLVTRGTVSVNGSPPVLAEHLVVLSRAGSLFDVRADADATLLVLGGEPIAEPVVGYGPFVMNEWEEISRAVHDVQDGRMGTLRSAMYGDEA